MLSFRGMDAIILYSVGLNSPKKKCDSQKNSMFLTCLRSKLLLSGSILSDGIPILTTPPPYQGLPTLRPNWVFLGIKHTSNARFLVASLSYWAESTTIENKIMCIHAILRWHILQWMFFSSLAESDFQQPSFEYHQTVVILISNAQETSCFFLNRGVTGASLPPLKTK